MRFYAICECHLDKYIVLASLPSLKKGDLPVLCTYQGDTRRLRKIAKSALTLNKLRKVTRVVYFKTAEEKYELKSAVDIMEVLL